MTDILIVALTAVITVITVVLVFARRMGVSSVRIKASIAKVFHFEIDLGGDRPESPHGDDEPPQLGGG